MFFPSTWSSTTKYSVKQGYDWSDYARSLTKLLERAAPNEGKEVSKLVGPEFPLGETHYHVHTLGLYVSTKGKPSKREWISKWNPRHLIMYNMGRGMLEGSEYGPNKAHYVAESWAKAIEWLVDRADWSIRTYKENAYLQNSKQFPGDSIDVIESYKSWSRPWFAIPIAPFLMLFLVLIVHHASDEYGLLFLPVLFPITLQVLMILLTLFGCKKASAGVLEVSSGGLPYLMAVSIVMELIAAGIRHWELQEKMRRNRRE